MTSSCNVWVDPSCGMQMEETSSSSALETTVSSGVLLSAVGGSSEEEEDMGWITTSMALLASCSVIAILVFLVWYRVSLTGDSSVMGPIIMVSFVWQVAVFCYLRHVVYSDKTVVIDSVNGRILMLFFCFRRGVLLSTRSMLSSRVWAPAGRAGLVSVYDVWWLTSGVMWQRTKELRLARQRNLRIAGTIPHLCQHIAFLNMCMRT